MTHSRRPLNWVQWVSLATSVSVAVLLPFIVIGIQNAHRDTNESIRKVLCYFEAQTLNDPRITATERDRTVRVFDVALEQINQPPCQ